MGRSDAALPGQDGTVRHKGRQLQPGQLLPDEAPVLRQGNDLLHLPLGRACVQQALLHADRDEVKQDLFQLGGVDGPAVGREAHIEAQGDGPGAHLAIRPLQHLLAGDGNGQHTAFARTPGLPGEPPHLAAEAPEKVVLQGGTVPRGLPAKSWEARSFAIHRHTELGGGGEGIALDMLDVQDIFSKRPAPSQGFVGGIASVVDGAQGGPQSFRCFHGKHRFLK